MALSFFGFALAVPFLGSCHWTHLCLKVVQGKPVGQPKPLPGPLKKTHPFCFLLRGIGSLSGQHLPCANSQTGTRSGQLRALTRVPVPIMGSILTQLQSGLCCFLFCPLLVERFLFSFRVNQPKKDAFFFRMEIHWKSGLTMVHMPRHVRYTCDSLATVFFQQITVFAAIACVICLLVGRSVAGIIWVIVTLGHDHHTLGVPFCLKSACSVQKLFV